MASPNRKLTATTPLGVFTRTTARTYTHVVVLHGVHTARHQAQVEASRAKYGDERAVDVMLASKVADQVANGPSVWEVQWAGRADLAQKAAAKLGKIGPVHIFPVDGTQDAPTATQAPARRTAKANGAQRASAPPAATQAATAPQAAKAATVKLSAQYLDWAHRPASEDGNEAALAIIAAADKVANGRRARVALTPAVANELRQVADLWVSNGASGEDVPAGYVRTARRILAEVPAPAAS